MFRHILVPLDGSARAEQALPIAARLARASQGIITLLQVVDLSYSSMSYGFTTPYVTQNTTDDDLSSARSYLEHLHRHSYLEGVSLQTRAVLGNPAEVIISQTADQPIDLILITSHGYTGMKRWIMGSVAEKVARHSLVPVFILRDGEPLRIHWNLNDEGFVRALVPLDTSPRSLAALAPAAELVAALSTSGQGKLHLAQMVVSPAKANTTEREKERLLQAANQNLTSISQSIRDGLVTRFGSELHPTLSWSASLMNDVAEGIVRMAEHGEENTVPGTVAKYDLIALTTHGTGGLRTWPVGSIAERVLHSTRLPILIVRPEEMIVKARQPREHHAELAAV